MRLWLLKIVKFVLDIIYNILLINIVNIMIILHKAQVRLNLHLEMTCVISKRRDLHNQLSLQPCMAPPISR